MTPPSPMHQIRASAGSGKTYAITSRFLSLLHEAARDPDAVSGCTASAGVAEYNWQEIMAVTFTNGAAAEMRERILERLKLMALGQWGPEALFSQDEAARWIAAILNRLHGLNVRTIDSLLHAVVRLSALELHLPPDFEPVFDTGEILLPLLDTLLEGARTDSAQKELLDAACRETVRHMPNFTGFQAGKKVRAEIVNLAMPLYGRGLPRLADADTLSARYADLSRQVREAAETMRGLVNAEKLNANKYFRDALDVCCTLTSRSPCPTSTTLRKSCLDECLNKASKGTASEAAQSAFTALYEAVFRMETHGRQLWAGLRLAPFATLALVLAAALRVHLESAGQVPQELMPALAAEALDEGTGVSETFCRMGAALRHMLIDEFQDTSREQWLAMRPLVQEMLAQGGTLTWVGDVKQAIYGWRGGDATLFDAVSREPELTRIVPGSSSENLPMNRRSRAEVVNFNNRVFSRLADKATAARVLGCLLPEKTPAPVLLSAADLLSHAFDNAAQEPSPDKPGGYVCLTSVSGELAADMYEAVHATFLQVLHAVLQRHSLGEVAVLTRSNGQVEAVATWLMQDNRPVVTDNSFRLAAHPLVQELLSLLEFLNNPDNDPAFAALVCGPRLFLPRSGLHIADLQDWLAGTAHRRAMKFGGEAMPLYQTFRTDFPQVWEQMLAPFFDSAGLTTVYDTVREALDHFDVWARFGDQFVFVQRFLEVLHEAENSGHSSLAAFLDFWSAHGAEEKAPMPDSVDAIRVMTVHKSKGLEFPVVICPWLDLEPKATLDPRFEILPPAAGFPQQLMLARPASGMDSHFQSLADNAREALHRLYVAWTRAGQELYAFVTATKRSNKGRAALNLLLDLPAMSDETADVDNFVLEYGDVPESTAADTAEATVADTAEAAAGSETVPAENDILPPPVPAPAHTAPADLTELTELTALTDQTDFADSTDPADPARWRPLHWMPRLKIFRSPLQALSFTAERRGTFVHHCLERLRLTGDPEADAARAVAQGLADFPVPLVEPELARADLTHCLKWYAALPEADHWLRYGTAEQSMWDAEGKLMRADLLVDDGDALTVVDYKTGDLNPAHHAQVQAYMRVLADSQPPDEPARPVNGKLVYLDKQTVQEVAHV